MKVPRLPTGEVAYHALGIGLRRAGCNSQKGHARGAPRAARTARASFFGSAFFFDSLDSISRACIARARESGLTSVTGKDINPPATVCAHFTWFPVGDTQEHEAQQMHDFVQIKSGVP